MITSLFADVVGSTTLAERVDAEEFRLIVSGALDRMAQAVERYGGTVKDLAGDGLLARPRCTRTTPSEPCERRSTCSRP